MSAKTGPNMGHVAFGRDAEVLVADAICIQLQVRVGDKRLSHRNIPRSVLPCLLKKQRSGRGRRCLRLRSRSGSGAGSGAAAAFRLLSKRACHREQENQS